MHVSPSPIDAMSRDEVRDLVRIHAKLFAFLRYSRANPGHDEERAHDHAARHWRQFRGMAMDYIAVKLALAERDAVAAWN